MVEPNKKPEIKGMLIRQLWWGTFVTAVLLTLISIPGYGQRLSDFRVSSGFMGLQWAATWLGVLLSVSSAILCLALALLVFLKSPGELMAMYLSFFLLIYGFVLVGPLEALLGYWLPPSNELTLLLPAFLDVILIFNLMLVLFLIFPTGRFSPRWTRWLIVATMLLTGGELLTFNVNDWQFMTTRAWIGGTLMFVIGLFTLGVQVHRYRRIYSLVERQQAKWVMIGLFAMISLVFIINIPYPYLLNLPPGAPIPWWEPLLGTGWWLSLTFLPVSLTFAILRYRLFDIDVLIRRTLIYGALTATLAVIYFISVVLIQTGLRLLTGENRSPVVTMVSTLVIAALFNPLRRRIQKDINRRFYRRKYDAKKTLEAFAASLRQEVDLDQIRQSLLAVVVESMQPERASLWLSEQEETIE